MGGVVDEARKIDEAIFGKSVAGAVYGREPDKPARIKKTSPAPTGETEAAAQARFSSEERRRRRRGAIRSRKLSTAQLGFTGLLGI
jgi:hypothetical protein